MSAVEDANQLGQEDAARAYALFADGRLGTVSADHVLYLMGMQAFCRLQLRRELTAAMNALESGVASMERGLAEQPPESPGRKAPGETETGRRAPSTR